MLSRVWDGSATGDNRKFVQYTKDEAKFMLEALSRKAKNLDAGNAEEISGFALEVGAFVSACQDIVLISNHRGNRFLDGEFTFTFCELIESAFQRAQTLDQLKAIRSALVKQELGDLSFAKSHKKAGAVTASIGSLYCDLKGDISSRNKEQTVKTVTSMEDARVVLHPAIADIA